jgi:hypothetical protein
MCPHAERAVGELSQRQREGGIDECPTLPEEMLELLKKFNPIGHYVFVHDNGFGVC